MKITLDTEKKLITIEGAVNFCDLHKLLKQLFPNDLKEWTVQAQPQIQWVYPQQTYTYFTTQPATPYAPAPWMPDWIDPNPFESTCGDFPN